MNITRFSDYTLRALIYLATHQGKLTSADEIATAYNISFHHIAKTTQWLSKHEYIHSERGRKGGISLKREAHDINIGTIIRATEAKIPLVECMGDSNTCKISPSCALKHSLAQAEEAFFTVLDKVSLGQLVQNKAALTELIKAELV